METYMYLLAVIGFIAIIATGIILLRDYILDNTCRDYGYTESTITRFGVFCIGLNESKEPFFVPYDTVIEQ